MEHILISVTIVSDKTSAGQFDDSCAHHIEKNLAEYKGVKNVDAQVLYKHTKIEQHVENCVCHYCTQK